MLSRITYFNIICSIVYLAVLLNIPSMYSNHVFSVGLLLAIGYNWIGIKSQMGQRIKWKKIILVVGIIVMIFGGLLIVDSVYKFIIAGSTLDALSKGTLFIALLQLVFGTTLLFQVSQTIRSYTQ